MPFDPNWLHNGNFSGLTSAVPSVMQEVRDVLCKRLGLQPKALRIAHFPPRATLKHCYWWREGGAFAEAQFFAEVSKTHAVLSLGVSVEKGREGAGAGASKPPMNRRTWDWDRLIKHLPKVLKEDLSSGRAVPPIQLRIRSRRRGRGASDAWELRAFSRSRSGWFQRHHGPTDEDAICKYIRALDREQDTWVVVHFACDFFPPEVEKLSVSGAASVLLAFDGIRQRVSARTPRP